MPWVLSTTLPSGRVPPLTVTGSPNTRALPFFTTSWLSVKATRPPASANTGSAGSTCSALRAKWYSPFTREASILARGSTSCRSRLPTPSTRKGSVTWLMLAATGLSAMKRRKSWVGPLAVPRTVSTSFDSKSGSTAVTSFSSAPKMRPRLALMRIPAPSKSSSPEMPSILGQPGA